MNLVPLCCAPSESVSANICVYTLSETQLPLLIIINMETFADLEHIM